jgi:repressor LexA
MGDKLTKRQEKVLNLIRDFFLQNNQAPSLGELQEMLGFKSKRGVVNHLIALENKGYIIRTSEPRGIQILDSQDDDNNIVYEYLIGIPIFGYANAGTPLAVAEEDWIGKIKVDKSILGKKSNKELFALIVKGTSMNKRVLEGETIEDGKYIVIDKDAEVQEGDTVVAIIDNSATVKNISFKNDDMVVLYPESNDSKHQPIYIDSNSDFLINGKVIKVLNNPMKAI